MLYSNGVETQHGRILDLVDFRKAGQSPVGKSTTGTIEQMLTIDNQEDENEDGDFFNRSPQHWLKFKQ